MILSDLALTFVIAFSIYATIIGVFGFWNSGSRMKQYEPKNRFAVLIPAHDEEAVIQPLIRSLREQDYPAELYDVYVIADNCSDGTAERARAVGARVFERSSDRRGKGHALRYALERLGFLDDDSANPYDAVAFFDADNLVDPKFLQVMNDRLAAGENLIQCFLDSKNPSDTWISSAYSILFWLNSRYMMLARYNLGFSAAFMGTGMCISARALGDVGWDVQTLTEDLEYSVQAVLHGYPTHYTHDTRVYDEKPLTLESSIRQRLRWARGQFDVAFRYLIPLLSSGLRRGCRIRFEAGLRLCQLFVLLAASPIFALHTHLGGGETWGLSGTILETIPLYPAVLMAVPYSLMLAAAIIDQHPAETYFYSPLYPVFTASWLAIMAVGLATFRHRQWMPTEHKRAVDMGQVRSRPAQTLSIRDMAGYETRLALAGGFSGTNWN